MNIIERMKNGEKISIGMVHTLPLPGSPRSKEDIDAIARRAVEDAVKLERAGFDALIVENVNDGPYEDHAMNYQKVAALTKVCVRVMDAVSIPVGIDSCGDPIAGFHIGSIAGLSFLRMPYFVDVRINARGIMQPNAGNAMTTRKRLGVEHIKIFADIQVKHSYPIVQQIPLEVSAEWAQSSGADAIIVTGGETGMETPLDSIKRVKAVAKVPVVAGSGADAGNVTAQYVVSDGAIVGSALKKDKNLLNPIDENLAALFIAAAKGK